MSFFQEQLERDARNVFLNPEEFGTPHIVNGREMIIVIDEDQLQHRKSSASNPTDGVYNASLLFYALKTDFEKRPITDSSIRIDDRNFKVADVQEDEVMYTITLKRVGS
ncbi:hypothetical protein JNUCC32_13465 [Paenibacillus sp. JNUCC32]|uniref:hypothetical protein n=1 Tax=Paenibacillus sp. JNUCC32 TaxID=2777984 RepID=UPI00178898B7|nr:hypothetical protein [Paenibacillus sp. JNUCC-32]QOT12965.1 hypothetical protein JNUCC32_13465 [Paenibacillus sp. JNUCC-32]